MFHSLVRVKRTLLVYDWKKADISMKGMEKYHLFGQLALKQPDMSIQRARITPVIHNAIPEQGEMVIPSTLRF